MITTLDATDIPNEALAIAWDCRIRYDKTTRRSGTLPVGVPLIPDANKVMLIYGYKDNAGIGTLFRFTPLSIYKNFEAWTALTGTLNGSATDYFYAATAFNQLVFSNNGVDPIQVIDPTQTSFAQLGNAPSFKYVTVFANRVVGANKTTPGLESPITIGWSGDGNITEWDPLVDQSAGEAPLIESPGDTADFITGVYGFTASMIILRERSIWLVTKQPSAENPFNAYAAVAGIGCNCPNSVAVIPGGIVFADYRTRKIYAYTPGQLPQNISTNVEKELFASSSDPVTMFGSYDNVNNEYSIAIPLIGTTSVRQWVYNFRTQAWSNDFRTNLSTIADIEGAGSRLSIDQLVGNIDDLIGTIDSLKGPVTVSTSRVYGFNDGSISVELPEAIDDSGNVYTTRLVSKTFTMPVYDQYIARVSFELFLRAPTIITLSYSTDGGKTFVFARTDSVSVLNEPWLLQWNRQVKCRKFTFKLESSSGDWDLIGYELHSYRSGDSGSSRGISG